MRHCTRREYEEHDRQGYVSGLPEICLSLGRNEYSEEQFRHRNLLIAIIKGALVDLRIGTKEQRDIVRQWLSLPADLVFSFRWCLNELRRRNIEEEEFEKIIRRISRARFVRKHVHQHTPSSRRVTNAPQRGKINYPKHRRKRHD